MAFAVALFAGSTVACYLAARAWWGDVVLARIAAVAFGARAVLALALYYVSYWQLPFLSSLQMGGGFWTFAPDSSYVDWYASDAAVALKAGLDLPFVSGAPDFPLMVAVLYRFVGRHPLVVVWLNIVSAALAVCLTFDLAKRLWSAYHARVAAVLVAFWPSALLWSTQLLKDALETLMVVAFFWAIQRIVESGPAGRERVTAVPWIVGFVSLFAAVRLRSYVGVLLLVSACVPLLAEVVAAVGRRERRVWMTLAGPVLLAGAVVTALVIPAEFAAKPIDSVSPAKRLAEYMAARGDVDGARRQIHEAFFFRFGTPVDPDERERQVAAQLTRLMAGTNGEGWPGFSQPTGRNAVGSEAPIEDGTAPPLLSRVARLFDTAALASMRQTFLDHGGWTLDQSEVLQGGVVAIAVRLPGALATTLFTPNPWMRSIDGSGVRYTALLELPLVCVMVVFGARGLGMAWRRGAYVGVAVVVFALLLMTGLGLVVPNVGALFRLRAAALVSLSVVACGGVPMVTGRPGPRWSPATRGAGTPRS